MHFVARNSTDTAYQTQGYALRPDPLVIFRQPPIIHGTTPSHSRTQSGSSFKLSTRQNNNDLERNVLEPLICVDKDQQPCTEAALQYIHHAFEHDCEVEHCSRVILNIAGLKFETQLKTLNRLPTTLLGNPSRRKKYWVPDRNEFFFDRHRPSFPAILYYYQSGGRLKRPVEVPIDIFLEELQFYQLGDSVIDAFKISEGFLIEDGEDEMPENKIQRLLWQIFEYPGSSRLSNVIAIVSVAFILTSIVTFCVETLPQFKNKDCINETVHDDNGTALIVKKFNYSDPPFIVESCCIVWFVFELLIRLIVCPSKMKFLKDIVNWIDLLSIAPYFIFMIMYFITNECQNNNRILSVLRVLRVVRIFKLSRFSDGLRILAKTMQVSMRELSMFVLFLGIGVIIFAGAIYYAEAQNENSFFTSIPDGFWWAVISMTTVGYGDVYPVGVLGKCVGGMCVLSGLLAIALPVPVIVTNFNNIYRQTTGRGNNM